MRLSAWSRRQLAERLEEPGLFLQTGPFLNRIRTRIPEVIDGMALLYAEHSVSEQEDFADFHVALVQPHGPRRWLRPQVQFEFDGVAPFKPLPRAQALPMLEWGLNWCIGNHAHNFMIIHAASIEKNGRAAVLPGPPGSGKSTLTAYLVHNGWRLLSDELALLSLADGRVTALARPISLKNQSIDLLRRLAPAAIFSRPAEDTAKGTVALLKVPSDSVARACETARPAWIIFPQFRRGAEISLRRRPKADTLIEVGRNAFNYSIHGQTGFEVLSNLVNDCCCYDLTYDDLAQAGNAFADLESEVSTVREASA